MANTDNKCSGLEIHKLQSPHFDTIFSMQKSLQEKLGYDFESMSLKEISEFWFFNKHAMDDEISEMFDALGGIDDGIGNAVWKKWKSKNAEGADMKISSLSQSDKKELFFEVVDMFHFAINFAVSIGMTGSDFFSMYKSKNEENIRRSDSGY